jgi:plastocyanin
MRRLLRSLPVAALAATALAISGCGDDSAGSDAPPTIVMSNFKYEPEYLQIEVGDRVTFVNHTSKPHSANSEYGVDLDPSPGKGPTDHSGKDVNHAWKNGFVTHSLFEDEPQTVVFHVARKYSYVCSFFPEMHGVIEVVPKDG